MRRLLMSLFAVFFTVSCMASNPLKNIVGKENLKSIMTSVSRACIVYDWSTAKYDSDKDLKASLGEDYDFVKQDCEDSFIHGFNSKSKGLILSKDENGAKYKFVLKVTGLDRFFQVMTFVPKHEGKMWGSLVIIDSDSGKTLAEMTIDEAEEGYDLVPKECFGKTFFNLGGKVAKLK